MHIQQPPFEFTFGQRGAIRIGNTTGPAPGAMTLALPAKTWLRTKAFMAQPYKRGDEDQLVSSQKPRSPCERQPLSHLALRRHRRQAAQQTLLHAPVWVSAS